MCKELEAEIASLKSHNDAAQDETSGEFSTPVTYPGSTHRRETISNASNASKSTPSEPDVLLIANSISKGIKPGQIFAPLYTRIEILENKNLDGALEFLEGASNIKPKMVVLHCLENDISKTRSGETVINKAKKVVSKCRQVFGPHVQVMVVEPIGRGTNKEQYERTANHVRVHLSTVVADDMIIKTEPLQALNRKWFADDQVHLKPAGRTQLCIAYKQHVYPKLGKEYTAPSERSRENAPRTPPQQHGQARRSRQEGNRRPQFQTISDNRMLDLVNLMREILR